MIFVLYDASLLHSIDCVIASVEITHEAEAQSSRGHNHLLLLVLDLGRSINARIGYATPVSVWQPSPAEYADQTWPPGADLPANAPDDAQCATDLMGMETDRRRPR